MTHSSVALVALALLVSQAALAQAPAPAAGAVKSHPTKPASASLAAPGANTTGHSAAAVDCSRQADAKGLHGKARASFRASCKAAAKKS